MTFGVSEIYRTIVCCNLLCSFLFTNTVIKKLAQNILPPNNGKASVIPAAARHIWSRVSLSHFDIFTQMLFARLCCSVQFNVKRYTFIVPALELYIESRNLMKVNCVCCWPDSVIVLSFLSRILEIFRRLETEKESDQLYLNFHKERLKNVKQNKKIADKFSFCKNFAQTKTCLSQNLHCLVVANTGAWWWNHYHRYLIFKKTMMMTHLE